MRQEQNPNVKTTQFEDIIYECIRSKYGVKKKVKQQCEEFLIGMQLRSRTDERVDDFKKFMGFEG